ncbi:MAG: cytochrome P450 [Xanthobacteraceae bacterium]
MTSPIDFADQDYLRNPAAKIAGLRLSGLVVEVRFPIIGNAWVTTTEEATSRVLKDGQAFTLRKNGATSGTRWWTPRMFRALASNLLTTDEPDHTRLRSIVDEAFRRRAILDMEPRILALADELAAALFAEGSPADLVDRYARTLPLAVICELLGLPAPDRPKFMAWTGKISGVGSNLGFMWRMYRGIGAIKRYLEAHLATARVTGGEGLIAELIRAEKEGAPISRDEMVAMVFLLLFAGNETVTHLISGSVYELLRKPGLRDWLAEDWNRADLAVEEFLRFVSPVQLAKPRFVRRDLDLCGVRLKQGDMVMALLAAANFDPAANPGPDRLDLERRPNRHLAFGTGIHFCLGHQLARIEGQCALKALFRRWPRLSMAIDPSQIQWRAQPNLRAIEKLPVIG